MSQPIQWACFTPQAPALLGFIPQFVSTADPRPVREQLDANYGHGGGWRPMTGWTFDPDTCGITYPGDETLQPIAAATVGDETILVYPHAWVAIVQNDETFEIARMD